VRARGLSVCSQELPLLLQARNRACNLQVFVLLLFAKVWSRLLELVLPVGFLLLLLATVPQFMSYIALVQRLDSAPDPLRGADGWQDVFLPNMVRAPAPATGHRMRPARQQCTQGQLHRLGSACLLARSPTTKLPLEPCRSAPGIVVRC
jgi:hypothetical protein